MFDGSSGEVISLWKNELLCLFQKVTFLVIILGSHVNDGWIVMMTVELEKHVNSNSSNDENVATL